MPNPNALDSDPRLPALLRWRQQLISSGAVSPHTFKEAHVRMVLRSGRRDVDEIRAMLPGSVAEYAEDMARVLDELTAETTGPARTADTGRVATRESVPEADSALYREGTPDSFAPFIFRKQTAEPHEIVVRPVADPASGQQALEITWPPYQSGKAESDSCAVYRVVSSEENEPYSPDRAQLVAVTTTTSAHDSRPPISAVRRFQVWVNTGASRAEALAAQPVLHAAGARPSPVDNVVLTQDSGRVIGQWTVFPRVSAVHLYRIPAEESAADEMPYQILADSDNLDGFVDTDAEPGRRYVYRARCKVSVDGVERLSDPVQAEVQVSAMPAPVDDLSLSPHDDGAVLDLSWTSPPAGRVLIFRTQDLPEAAESAQLPESALELAGLRPASRLNYPISERRDSDGRLRSVIAGVPWPSEWSRAYFTPVTVLDGRARLGKSISTVRTGSITDVQLTEYCSKQVLTFAWPAGAAAVSIYLAPKDYDPQLGLSGRHYEVSFEDYHKFGGHQFPKNELPPGGCSLHLAPVAFSAGRRIQGAITSLQYVGLLRLWYSVKISRDPAGNPLTAALLIRAETDDVIGSPPFVLVNNAQRIPLSITDGEPLDVAPLNDQGEVAARPAKQFKWPVLRSDGTSQVFVGDVRGRQGWVRLFADVGDPKRLQRLALLDPPVDALRLTRTSS
ncbi:hypothetical protein C3477_05865 [Mycobacterium kansasii]|uniref:hypothetical protein n=1 Tax=Mycobacterium kansasii TaxID=1768 RepID=UPI000CDD97D0|nr:hypothetical protein [Mycobacterium kansasii]POX91134.1 hypothetical protein C3B43_04480 [Mycobacterium kansasii]POY07960.1 hypothetical protein C3477_05865 [Mycobacterium kansasii]POY23293.1 hypothetical protein C3476_08320 [Mycobacterium kansasii]